MLGETSEAIANNFASAYSQAFMIILEEILSASRSLSTQTRHDILVTRVFKAPLFALITLFLLYALLSIALMTDASRAIRRQGVADVHARLGLAELAVECFEEDGLLDAKIDDDTDLFGEKNDANHVKIGFEQSVEGGGWRVKGYEMGKDP